MQSPQTSQPPQRPRVRLADARADLGLSQQGLAERIGSTYVNVSRWERGITRPSPYFRRKLCTLFGRTEEELDLAPSQEGNKKGRKAASTSKETSKAIGQSLETASSTIFASQQPIYDPAIPLQPTIQLVGREKELDHIKQHLCSKKGDMLTALNGLPGVGKTALSITLAHDPDIRAYFKDGVLWAGLGPNPNLPGLLSRWGSLLGISATEMSGLNDHEAWAKAVRNAIGQRSMLLVIDDAWLLEEALTFRVGGPNCAHLVSTRFPRIAAAMTIDGATAIKALSEEDSIKLLGQLAPQVINREQQRAHDLVQAVGGLPLALTLMGNYLRKQAYSGPARRITAALERLNNIEERMKIEEPHVPAESHPSLPIEQSLSIQSVIAVTDQLLDEKTQRTLYALAVFPPKPDSFSEESALAVADCGYDELDTLSDTGLLETYGNDRYQLHQVIADYTRLQISAEQLRAAQERLVAYVVDYIETHKKDYEQLELESNTILIALDKAYEMDRKTELVKATIAFAPFLIMRGFYKIAEHHLQRAHKAAIEIDDNYGKADTFFYIGEVAQKQGNYVQAESLFQAGLQLAREIDDKENICALLNGLGEVNRRKGDANQAEAYLREGLKLARQIMDRERVCSLLKTLGSVAYNQGNYTQSETYLKEGLDLARQIGHREQACFLLSNLGATVGSQGKHAQAEKYFREGLELARQIGHREQICVLLINLGDAIGELGNYDQAEKLFQEGLQIARQLDNKDWISALLINLGMTMRKQRKYEQANDYLQESLNLARKTDRPQVVTNALNEYGNLCIEQNQVDLAAKLFEEMLAVVPKGDQEMLALAQYGLARVAAAHHSFQRAKKLGSTSVTTLESIGHRSAEEARQWLNTINI